MNRQFVRFGPYHRSPKCPEAPKQPGRKLGCFHFARPLVADYRGDTCEGYVDDIDTVCLHRRFGICHCALNERSIRKNDVASGPSDHARIQLDAVKFYRGIERADSSWISARNHSRARFGR